MNDIISVIVPVYNVSEYLSDCVESILAQTYPNLEIILIDDGSNDGSGELCDELATRNSCIKVIHQKNSGSASAKNAGLRIAIGDYLAFVDGDDYLEPDAYAFMLEQMKKYNADVVRCGFRDVFINNILDKIDHLSFEVSTAEEFLRKFTTDWTCGLLWDKLYRRVLFQNVLFEEGHKIDDEFFTYQGLMNAQRIVTVPRVVYNYRKRKSSVMFNSEFKEKLVMDKLAYSEKRRQKVTACFPNLKRDYDNHYANFLLILCRDPYMTSESLKKAKRQIRAFLCEKVVWKVDIRIIILLLKVLVTPITILLAHRKENENGTNLEYFFN